MAVAKPKRLALDDVLIVDCDVHAHETPEALAPYMDAEWRPAMENLTRVAHRYLNRPGFAPINQPERLGSVLPGLARQRTQIVWNAEQMRSELDALSIDVGVIFPDHFLKIATLPNASYASAIARAYHRWIKDHWLHEENDLYATMIAVPQDPEEGAREIARWAGDERFTGIYLPTSEVYPMWGHRKYDPIFEAAQRFDLPLFLHSVGGLGSGFPFNCEQFYTSISSHTVNHVFAMMGNWMNMMETGVPVRYPDLRICFAESGLTWVPFLRMRLDKEHAENRRLWPHFNDRPSRWMRKFYFATQPVEEPENRRDLVDIIRIYDGEDTTVFASDWPHHDFDHPKVVFNLPVSDEMKRKLMGANALKLMPRIQVPIKYQGAYRSGESL